MGSDNYHWALIGRSAEEASRPAACGCSSTIRYCPLHAAAPALAEALEALLSAEWMVTHDWGGDRDGVTEKARAALEAARGRG